MPIEVYAALVDPQIVRDDVRFAERQAEQGIPPVESARNLTNEHIRRTEADQSNLSIAERYANRVTELVRVEPDQPIGKILENLQPTSAQAIHWEPAMAAIGAAQTDTLVWRREHGDIQSYQQVSEPHGWLHIDSLGQFFDRNASPILTEQALFPLGFSSAGDLACDRGEAKGIQANLGVDLS